MWSCLAAVDWSRIKSPSKNKSLWSLSGVSFVYQTQHYWQLQETEIVYFMWVEYHLNNTVTCQATNNHIKDKYNSHEPNIHTESIWGIPGLYCITHSYPLMSNQGDNKSSVMLYQLPRQSRTRSPYRPCHYHLLKIRPLYARKTKLCFEWWTGQSSQSVSRAGTIPVLRYSIVSWQGNKNTEQILLL